jgi:methylmalonyl-CoA mutase cobalamin-binding subunit
MVRDVTGGASWARGRGVSIGLPPDAGRGGTGIPEGEAAGPDWLGAVRRLDRKALDAVLVAELARLGLGAFVLEVVSPMLHALGCAWADEGIRPYQEHFASEQLREVLARQWRALADHNRGPLAVCATLPGEQHVLGLHLVASLLALAGWRVVFLGAEMPPGDLAGAVTQSGAAALFLSVSEVARPERTRELFGVLRRELPSGTHLVAGGRGAPAGVPGVILPGSLRGFARWLEQTPRNPVPLTTLAIPIPAEVRSVTPGDVDGDGVDELVLEVRVRVTGQPDRVRLVVLDFGPDGRLARSGKVELGNKAQLWDTRRGLWTLDGTGFSSIDAFTGAVTRVLGLRNPLGWLGPATPRNGPIAFDLDQDRTVELVGWAEGRFVVGRPGATAAWGSIPAPADGAINLGDDDGGRRLSATVRPPSLAVADLDGDARDDLLLPRGNFLRVYYTGANPGSRAAEIHLPFDLSPDETRPRPGVVRREVAGVWFKDFDGDRKADLGVYRLVYSGSFFGATTEWVWAKGDGDSFGPVQVVALPQAGFGFEPVDLDGNGVLEVVGATIDVGFGNLARALVSREAKADLVALRLVGETWSSTPTPLHSLRFSIEAPDRLHVQVRGDVDGDRRRDLVTDDGGAGLSIFRGSLTGFEAAAAWTAPVTVPVGEGHLLCHDVTGDGRAEIFVWGEDGGTASLLRLGS